MEIPNLDAMNKDELLEFVARGEKDAARKLFPGRKNGLQVLKSMHRYAKTKIMAIDMRSTSSVQDALVYESICDSIYSELPEWAQW